MKKKQKQKQKQTKTTTKKHAPLQGSVRGYIREISVGMFLQIQTDIYIYICRNRPKQPPLYSLTVSNGIEPLWDETDFFIFFRYLQSSQVKRTPQNSINEFIIRKLSPLAVVDFRFISTFLHA